MLGASRQGRAVDQVEEVSQRGRICPSVQIAVEVRLGRVGNERVHQAVIDPGLDIDGVDQVLLLAAHDYGRDLDTLTPPRLGSARVHGLANLSHECG